MNAFTDRRIAGRINRRLLRNETGFLFMGATDHAVADHLETEIEVIPLNPQLDQYAQKVSRENIFMRELVIGSIDPANPEQVAVFAQDFP